MNGGYAHGSSPQLHHIFNKRHRSLTPNLPNTARGNLPGYPGPTHSANYIPQPRYHPYSSTPSSSLAVPTLGYRPDVSNHRASSLGPNPLHNRPNYLDHSYSATDANIVHEQVDLRLLTANGDSQFSTRNGDMTLMPNPFESDFSAASGQTHGLKDGADGDQSTAQKLAEWSDSI